MPLSVYLVKVLVTVSILPFVLEIYSPEELYHDISRAGDPYDPEAFMAQLNL
jgi:hypothetical protein